MLIRSAYNWKNKHVVKRKNRKLQWIKEKEFIQLLEDKESSTEETLSGISYDSMDWQTLIVSEEVSEIQNSNTLDLLWKDLLADPDQFQLTSINLNQSQLILINSDQPQLVITNPGEPQLISTDFN